MKPHRAGAAGTTSCPVRRSERPGQRVANQITIACILFAAYLTAVIAIATTVILALD